MPQSESSQRMLEVTVVKAEGFKHLALHGYYVECTVGDQTKKTKTAKPTKKDKPVEWNEAFSFAVDDASKLLLKVFIRNRLLRDEEEGGIEMEISGMQTDKDIQIPLVENKQKSQLTTRTLTIRCSWKRQSEMLTNIMHGTSEALGTASKGMTSRSDGLDKANDGISAGKKIISAAGSWESFVANVELFNTIVTELSEVHPYAKAALSIVKGLTGIFIAQVKRDDKIVDLVGTMNDTYDLLREGEPLGEKEQYGKLLKGMALQTMECGYFIQAYLKDGFFKRTVKSMSPRVDKAIDDYQAQFTSLRTSLGSHTSLDTAVQVYRIMDTVEDLSATINLNEMTYAEGMRYSLEFCCLPGTRKDILNDIIQWANDTENESRVFLLTGLAGSGKSSIAHSVASHFKGLDRLGSSFFCTRSNLENSLPEKVFSTIARDIADQNKQVLQKLTEVVRMNKSLSTTRSVREQFQDFIKNASDGLTMVGPLVIVIDALDECEGNDALRKELMKILAEDASSLALNFRIFLTARNGDSYVENAFRSAKGVSRMHLENADRTATNSDIYVFVGEKLKDIAEELSAIHVDWQKELTEQSSGIFIWAATACKYILGEDIGGFSLQERYEEIQKLRSHGVSTEGMEPVEIVFDLYTTVLMSAFKRRAAIVMERFKKVLGVIVTASTPLSTNAIEELSGVGNVIISKLGSLLIGWDDGATPVQVLHASFPDYLADAKYSGDFHIDIKYRHPQMALFCLELMNRRLKLNICEFEDPYDLYENMQRDELEKKRQEHISEALQYACRYWATHVVEIDPSDSNYDLVKEALHQFLFGGKHLLQWVEIMSLIESIDVAKRSVRTLFEWTKRVKEAEPKTHRLIYDCCRFLEVFSHPITLGPLQSYLSALPYIPSNTVLYELYSGISGLEPQVIFGQESDWSLRRSYLPISGKIIASAFSTYGARVACLSDSGELQVFDYEMSAPVGKLIKLEVEGKDTLDNATIVLSYDKVAISHSEQIEVWDFRSGACIYHEPGFQNSSSKIPMAFQADDIVVACQPSGSDIELWTLELNSLEATICTFAAEDGIECIALSSDGRYVGCVSFSRSVLLWDVNSKEEIERFDCSRDGESIAMGISYIDNSVAIAYGHRIAMWNYFFIWNKYCESTSEIFMPPMMGLGHLVTKTYDNQTFVWDMQTGNHNVHKSRGVVQTMSHDGEFLVVSDGRETAIYSVQSDVDEPFWETSDDTEANKPYVFENKEIMHIIVSPSGMLIAAGRDIEDNTVFVWEGLGEMDKAKRVRILKGPTPSVWDVKLSPDGMKVASQDRTGDVSVWARAANDAEFELLNTLEFSSGDAAEKFFNEPSRWQGAEDSLSVNTSVSSSSESQVTLNSRDGRSESAEQLTENLMFVFDNLSQSEWVTTAEGKRLWWIPNEFREGNSSQDSCRIVLYNSSIFYNVHRAVVFSYIGNIKS